MSNFSYNSFFSALADSRRIEILEFLLKNGKQNVTSIANGIKMEQSAVSHSLNKLLACEFVHLEVRGKHRYYYLNGETIKPLLKIIDRHISKFCNQQCPCCTVKSADFSKYGTANAA